MPNSALWTNFSYNHQQSFHYKFKVFFFNLPKYIDLYYLYYDHDYSHFTCSYALGMAAFSIGCLFNMIAFIVVLASKMHRRSMGVYLCCLLVADTIVLVCLISNATSYKSCRDGTLKTAFFLFVFYK